MNTTKPNPRKTLLAMQGAVLAALLLAGAPAAAQDASVTVRPPGAHDEIPEIKTLPESASDIARSFRAAQARRDEINRSVEVCRAAAAREDAVERAKLTCHTTAASDAIAWRRDFQVELLEHAADLRALAERLRMEDAEVERKIDGASGELIDLEKTMELLRAAYRANLAPLESREILTREEEEAFDAFARDVTLLAMNIDEVTAMRGDYVEQRGWYAANTDDLDTWSQGLEKLGHDLVIPIEQDAIYIRTATRRGKWITKVEGHGEVSFAALKPMIRGMWESMMTMPDDRPVGGAPSTSAGLGSFPETVSDSRAYLKAWARQAEELIQ